MEQITTIECLVSLQFSCGCLVYVTDGKWAFADVSVPVHVVVVAAMIRVRSGLRITWTNLTPIASAFQTRVAPIKLKS